MDRPTGLIVVVAFAAALGATVAASAAAPYRPEAEELRAAYARADRIREDAEGKVFKTSIDPHWFDGDARFWYRNDGRGGAREFVLVDTAKGTRSPAFDHARLAAALGKALGAEIAADALPLDAIEFGDRLATLTFRARGFEWSCALDTYALTRGKPTPQPAPRNQGEPGRTPPRARGDGGRTLGMFGPVPRDPDGLTSPDGRWVAEVRDDNVVVRPTQDRRGEHESILTHVGRVDRPFGELSWSPDSKTLVAFRIEPATRREVHLVESSPRQGGRARLWTRPYDLPGDPMPSFELWLFEVETKRAIRPEVEPVDFRGPPRLRWRDGGARFTYEKTDRGHQRFRLLEVDARSGRARTIIDERSKTFVNTYTDPYLEYLARSSEILFKSERDGWAHLYLIDEALGEVKAQVTKGEWVVRGVDRVDQAKRQVWFRASGRDPGEDPYHVHHYRVNFDGSDLVELTGGDGDHSVRYSPGRVYLIDTYSRVDMPPVHALRRTSDGALVRELERADVSALEAAGWRPPEVFHAKGRDGATEIWGVVHRPRVFDPLKRYPVVEQIYAGPHGAHVPKRFSAVHRAAALAELGFIVVQIDGMGTAFRSKAFHDVCWKDLADAGFPDRIRWIEALAAKYPYVDATRVGVHGTSAGGQNAAGAVLFHPEFYKAAVASCGCHDNRMDKASWNEQWMGYPVGPHYRENSNITHAAKLRGKLLLIVGELDANVPPESTYRFADALIKANKDFDLLVVPGAGHTDGGSYGERRRRDFFVRHLHHVEPPDHNALQERPGASSSARPASAGAAPSVEPQTVPKPEPVADWPLTRAERSDYRETSSLADVSGFLDALKAKGAPIVVETIGRSAGNKPLLMAVASRPAVKSAAEARAAGKLVVYVQANIHGGEVEGKEAALMLLRALARGDAGAAGLLDKLVLLVVPIYNVDGNEALGPGATRRASQDGPDRVGDRPNAAGLDLNRDAIKALAPETLAVLENVYKAWDPDVMLDLHTTNGTRHGYILTYAPPLNPNTEPGVLGLARDELLPAVRDRLKREKGWLLFDYGNAETRGGVRAWHTFGDEGRYVTNYAGLRNRVGILSEAASFQPFRLRVEATFAFVAAVLDELAKRSNQVREVIRVADARVVAWGVDPSKAPALGVRFEPVSRGVESVPLETLPPGTKVDHHKAPDPSTLRPTPLAIHDRFRATRSAPFPAAYVLPADRVAAVALLTRHGIAFERLTRPWEGPAEVFEVAERATRRQAFQGGALTRLEGRFTTRTTAFPAGTILVRTAQPLGILAGHLLEPEGLDGASAWGFLEGGPAIKLMGKDLPNVSKLR